MDDCVLLNASGEVVYAPKDPAFPNAAPVAIGIKSIPAQFDGLTLEQITRQVCGVFPLNVVVDAELQNDTQFNVPYVNIIKHEPSETIGAYLDRLCQQKNVVLSHTNDGSVLLTRHKADKLLTTKDTLVSTSPTPFDSGIAGAPKSTAIKTKTNKKDRNLLYVFEPPKAGEAKKWVRMKLDFVAQAMHSVIHVIGEASPESANAVDSLDYNPYVNDQSAGIFKAGLRYKTVIQTSPNDNDSEDNARAIINDELKNVVLTIDVEGWTLGGNLITPNQLIGVIEPEIYCYGFKNGPGGNMSPTVWFIQEVALHMDEKEESATLTCVSPYCFSDEEIKNIFAMM